MFLEIVAAILTALLLWSLRGVILVLAICVLALALVGGVLVAAWMWPEPVLGITIWFLVVPWVIHRIRVDDQSW